MAVLYRVGDRVRINNPVHKHHNCEMVIDQVYPGHNGNNSYLAYGEGSKVFWGFESNFTLLQFAPASSSTKTNPSRKLEPERKRDRGVIRHAKAVQRVPRKRPGEKSYHL